MSSRNLINLPLELLQHVASFLDIEDLIRLCRVACIRDGAVDVIARRFRTHAGILCFACETGRYQLAAALLSYKADPNLEWTPERTSSLREHPACGRIPSAATMLAVYTSKYLHIGDPEDIDDEIPYCTHHWNVCYPRLPLMPDLDLDTVRVLRKHPASPSWLPLHVAARSGDIGVVDLLLTHGAQPDIYAWGVCRCRTVTLDYRSGFGKGSAPWMAAEDQLPVTPLHVALCYRQTAVAKLLFNRCSVPSEPSRRLESGPIQAPEAPRWLEEAPHTAAATGNIEFFLYLFNKDPKIINRKDAMGLTPLFHAYANRQHAMVRWLLDERGTDPNILLGRGLPLVYMACLDGDFRFAEDLIAHGAEVVEPLWGTPLLKPPVDAEDVSIGGATLLELCATLHYLKNCRQAWNLNKEQHTRIEEKFDQERLAFMRCLLFLGARKTATLLFTAAAQRSVPMLQLLLDSDAKTTDDSALLLHEVINSSRIKFCPDVSPDPRPTLQWLMENGVTPGRNLGQTIDLLYASVTNASDRWMSRVLPLLLNQAATHYASQDTSKLLRHLQEIHRSPDVSSLQKKDFLLLMLEKDDGSGNGIKATKGSLTKP